ncbi:MAG TPA: GWxTD domain-containing protein [Bacteroidetes bacterium]|nr:GWxTD domain-containing protein [Bacteroidota bacterium]
MKKLIALLFFSIFVSPASLVQAQQLRPGNYLEYIFAGEHSVHQATALFYNNLNMLRDSTDYNNKMISRLFIDLNEIISPVESKSWQTLKTNAARVEFLLNFWRQRDPTRSTFANERLYEHYKRLLVARKYYANKSEKGYDDRGRVYIRYGEPDQIYEEEPLELGQEDLSFRTPLLSWFYYRLEPKVVFDFVENRNGYTITYNINQGLEVLNAKDAYEVMKKIYEKRSIISPAAQAIAFGFRDKPDLTASTANDAYQKIQLMETGIKFAEDMKEKHQKIPPVVSTFFKNLPFDSIVSYLENPDKSQTCVVVHRVDSDKINFSDGQLRADITVTTTLGDEYYNIISEKTGRIEVPRSGSAHLVHPFALRAGDFYIFSEVLNEAARQQGKTAVLMKHVPRPADSLGISSILLADQIRETAKAAANSTVSFWRNGLEITPIASRTFSNQDKKFLYFEVYGLKKDADGKTSYDIAYTVKDAKEGGLSALAEKLNPFSSGKRFIEFSESRQGTSARDVAWSELDFTRMKKGKYNLFVQVRDRNSGALQRKVFAFELK